jgi:predicted helicase
MQQLLHTILLRSPPNLFDEFTKECQKWYEAPAHTFTEMRTRDNKKIRGDVFEDFCVLYLKHVKGYTNVWRLADVPDHVLGGLSLKRPDMGIDIIAEKDGKYTAVQCKYKKHSTIKPKNILSWKALSTFYALCLRTGPWDKYIVMTNCDYVRHAGKKTPKDLSICLKTFQNTTKEEWTRMCEIEGEKINQSSSHPKTMEELRSARLAYFQTACNTAHKKEELQE